MEEFISWLNTLNIWESELLNMAGKVLFYIVAGLVIKRILTKLVMKTLNAQKKRLSERKVNTLKGILRSLIKYSVYFIMAVQVLGVFGVQSSSIIALAGVGGVAIGIGAQSVVKDLLTGLFILMEDQFGVGDVITVENLTGTVEAIGIRTTRIRSFDAKVHIIPNSSITIVTNCSQKFSRAIVDIGISYHENMEKVNEVISDEAVKMHESIKGLREQPKLLGITAFLDSTMNLRMVAECDVGENWRIEREMREGIIKRMQKENISVPTPRVAVTVEEQGEGTI